MSRTSRDRRRQRENDRAVRNGRAFANRCTHPLDSKSAKIQQPCTSQKLLDIVIEDCASRRSQAGLTVEIPRYVSHGY